MENLNLFCKNISATDIKDLESLKQLARDNFNTYKVYPDSLQTTGGSILFIAKDQERKVLVVLGEGSSFGEFSGSVCKFGNFKAKVCELNINNCDAIRKLFPFTNPSNHHGVDITFGLGDRLGFASAGHLRLVKGMPVFPVLAQQSIRELTLTGRTYPDVLASASWAVFQEGYTSGYGADGDHLKTSDEVRMAIDCGYTMITLDCSEHIDNKAAALSQEEIDNNYSNLPLSVREQLEAKYLGKEFILKDGTKLFFTAEDYKKIVLVYQKAINYTIDIYSKLIKTCGRSIDFEMSIDETLTPTSAESHYFVAAELISGGVVITSLAPRFCGEFQKGIDYKGDIALFTVEFEKHVSIANHFGYKISVHSGSDKFSVFPIIGEKTGGRYHVKTAGTNWLEAVRIIALKNPSLYRRMHKFGVEHLHEAKKYYHISADLARVPDIDNMKDAELPGLMDLEDSRQVLHITYGLILLARNPDGTAAFRDEIYSTLNRYEAEYYSVLEKHIGKHLELLGINK